MFSVSESEIKATQREGMELLTLKQMLQRLPIALAQVKVGNTSESLLNEIHQIIYSFVSSKKSYYESI